MMLMPHKKTQKALFWVLTILIGLGLLGSSIVWTLPDEAGPVPDASSVAADQESPDAEGAGTDLSSLEAKVKADPQDIPSHLQLAQTYRAGGDFEKAIAVYQAILGIDEGNANARLSLAEVCVDLGRYDEALGELDQVLAANPRHQAAFWTAVGVLVQGKQDYQGAIARLDDYIKLVGDGSEAEQARQMITVCRQAEQQAKKDAGQTSQDSNE